MVREICRHTHIYFSFCIWIGIHREPGSSVLAHFGTLSNFGFKGAFPSQKDLASYFNYNLNRVYKGRTLVEFAALARIASPLQR